MGKDFLEGYQSWFVKKKSPSAEVTHPLWPLGQVGQQKRNNNGAPCTPQILSNAMWTMEGITSHKMWLDGLSTIARVCPRSSSSKRIMDNNLGPHACSTSEGAYWNYTTNTIDTTNSTHISFYISYERQLALRSFRSISNQIWWSGSESSTTIPKWSDNYFWQDSYVQGEHYHFLSNTRPRHFVRIVNPSEP